MLVVYAGGLKCASHLVGLARRDIKIKANLSKLALVLATIGLDLAQQLCFEVGNNRFVPFLCFGGFRVGSNHHFIHIGVDSIKLGQ
jgi:hypothetical protein